jgi:hypothetical protein
MQRVRKILLVSALLLTGLIIIVGKEWPLPAWALKKLQAEMALHELQITPATATFDFFGNIHLSGVRGRYQKLSDFTARQILVRVWPWSPVEIMVDGGRFHTGFLRLPIPETIDFSAFIRLENKSVALRFVGLKAGSLVVVLRGNIPDGPNWITAASQKTEPKNIEEGAQNTSEKSSLNVVKTSKDDKDENQSEDSKQEELLSDLIAKLCSQNQLWVADSTVDEKGLKVLVSGGKLEWLGSSTVAPRLQFTYPFTSLLFSADSFSYEDFSLKNPSLNYNASEDYFWRGFALGGGYKDFISASALSASGRWNLALPLDLNSAKDLSVGADLVGGGFFRANNISLSPLSADIKAKFPPGLLSVVGLRVEGNKLGECTAKIRDEQLFFDYKVNGGSFYDLSFNKMQARGRVNEERAIVDHFDVAGPAGEASGSLLYTLSTRRTDYRLAGRINPLMLPWFGEGWNSIFKSFDPMFAQVSLHLVVHPNDDVVASGVASVAGHHYKLLPLDKTVARFVFDEKVSRVDFRTRHSAEEASGYVDFSDGVSASIEGKMKPKSLALAYLDEPPEILDALTFDKIPHLRATLKNEAYTVSIQSEGVSKFYSVNLENLKGTVSGDDAGVRIKDVEFGFSGGRAGLSAQLDGKGRGYGSLWVRDANLGQWSLLGPLTELLRTKWLSIGVQKFNSADGSFTLEPGMLNIDSLKLWGNDAAADARGKINTAEKTVDMTVKINAFGGKKSAFGVVVSPLMQPFTSVVEARARGPIENPQWSLQLSSPFGL